ncbi:MAG: hypothetical protein M1819_002860 [Sarea resinae]|nr:MAG: hypothetical protein M1819_002860 [Sarea resinae]
MAAQTPRRSLARPRPSLGSQALNTSSTPNLGSSFSHPPLPNPQISGLSASAIIARKASLNQLTSGSLSAIPDSSAGYGLSSVNSPGSPSSPVAPTTPAAKRMGPGVGHGDIELGDTVEVPGGMFGTVKFIGTVKGKKGVFAGVELNRDWAPRGKNDGDVDGIRYFSTSIPNSGIFLPVSRASKRASPSLSSGSFPPTPTTPSLGEFPNPQTEPANSHTPPTPSMPKFSQSVGQGRAPSPQFKPKSRPSLPRPESPLRKQPTLMATPGRPSLGAPGSKMNGLSGPRPSPSPGPGRFGNPTETGRRLGFTPKTGLKTPGTRPGSRSQSRMSEQSMPEQDNDATPIGVARTSDGTFGALARARPGSGNNDEEVQRLKVKLEQRDKQLKEQASSLAEMETSLAEIQSLMPSAGGDMGRSHHGSGSEDADASQLRAILREKNEKIAMLTTEFDAHRADFRSTIDTLELASTETERVYERRIEDLTQEIRELQDRSEDVESVARQLKQLEELVQELEEGLEDARRGEAEARGEVEFLRGEVERGRSELRREREKAAAALKGAGAAVDGNASPGGSKEVEQRDDEIRGLKAIIHSLSRDSVPPDATSPILERTESQRDNGFPIVNQQTKEELAEERQAREQLTREVKELEGLIERKSFREEELEREIERLRRNVPPNQRGSVGTLGSSHASERTVTQSKRSSARDSSGTVVGRRDPVGSPETYRHAPALDSMTESDNYSSDADGGILWCEICETTGHDILTCTKMFGKESTPNDEADVLRPSPSSPADRKHTGREAVVEGLKGLSVSSPHNEDRVAPLSPARRRSPAPPSTPQKAPAAAPMPSPMDLGAPAPGKASGVVDPNKWCALCERDGHESVDCPFEDAI